MNKGLEALKRNRNFIERYFVKQVEETGVYHKDMKDKIFNDLSIVEKELKALEIIIKKRANVTRLMLSQDLLEYNDNVAYEMELTQEEYYLLKEVLCSGTKY